MTGRWGEKFSTTSKIGAVAVIVLLIIASLYFTGLGREEESIKIAAILPLTGRGAHLVDVVRALEMAVETINKWGGINGAKIDLVIRDSKSNRTTAELEFDSLESSVHPLIYFSTMCSISLRLSMKAEQSGVVLMTSGVELENLTHDKDWTFRYYPKTSEEVATVLSMVDKLGISSLGVLYADDMCTKAAKAILEQGFDVPNGTIVSQVFKESEEEYYEELGNLTDSEAIVIYGPTERYPTILAELRELEYPGKVIGTLSASDPSVVALDEADGMYLCAPYIYNRGYIYARDFITQFEETYGIPLTHRGAAMYDSMLVFRGLLHEVELTRENIKASLETAFLYSGLMGAVRNVQFGHDLRFPIYPVMNDGGELVYQW